MSNDVVQITDETKNKLKELDFDEQEAYFLLCQIFSNAQATKDYVKFQTDLNEWKKRFPIDKFSDTYKHKIKYMLSKEFLDTVLKNFMAFDELSKKDPAQGLEKLRKILHKAEKHKDGKLLDKDLDDLYKEYPLKYLKEKYPHVVGQLLSIANRTRILEKFDSSLAFKELDNILQHPNSFENVDDFRNTIEEWQKLYPTVDFNDKFRPQVEKTLTETLDSKRLEELFPVSAELDLSLGEVIPLELKESVKDISLLSKDALHEFFKIVDKNKGDVNSLFKWICKYNRYINSFDASIKTAIVDNLMTKYSYELPPVSTKYQIPKMDTGANDLLSLSDYENMDDTKKQVLLQVLGILSTGRELTHEDIYRIAVIDSNAKKVETIQKAKIEPKLDLFMEKFPEDKLTPSLYLEPESDTRIDVSVDNNIDLTLHDENDDLVIEDVKIHTDENDNLVVEDDEAHTDSNDNSVEEDNKVHSDEPTSFKETIKVEETFERVNISGNNGSSDSTGTSGGGSVSITSTEMEETNNEVKLLEEDEENAEQKEVEAPNKHPVQNFFNRLLGRDRFDDGR